MSKPCEEVRKTELLEALAELEHKQWTEWSMSLVDTETLSPERVERWRKLWRPYRELTEEEKFKDREYAEQVLWIVKKHMGIK